MKNSRKKTWYQLVVFVTEIVKNLVINNWHSMEVNKYSYANNVLILCIGINMASLLSLIIKLANINISKGIWKKLIS
jgi:hypothetical protein